jgi:hypothetical protein
MEVAWHLFSLVVWRWLNEWSNTASLIGGTLAIAGVIVINMLGSKQQSPAIETKESTTSVLLYKIKVPGVTQKWAGVWHFLMGLPTISMVRTFRSVCSTGPRLWLKIFYQKLKRISGERIEIIKLLVKKVCYLLVGYRAIRNKAGKTINKYRRLSINHYSNNHNYQFYESVH